MNFIHIIELTEPSDQKHVGSLAYNDFLDYDNCSIILYLENFKFRKNVNYKNVAKNMNKYFLYELICAMSRRDMAFETTDLSYTICGHGGFDHYAKCPVDFIIREMM